ncbi:3-dehydroquinate synthase [Picrophilus oshimae]|uniref:3-dehydroquinate synthase n=1 Tax=Picrophilus torridus (strain ATCC 700027 / DSM 9790 / JCM 10055 / NBRC 100828 / KAW 2/3) TaxID=1122961 RepID=A0A8G2FW10_PICTO|nr:3-dehydroquinate synthase family protein [Picrophilus oshimae]SMD30511.1 3-dehydroquinate synthase [Picrophilus oshimae DSM 9789]
MDLKYKLGNDVIRIVTGKNILKDFACELNSGGNISIISRNVYKKYDLSFIKNRIIIDDGERAKSMEYLTLIINELLNKRVERGDSIIYIGGGTTGDLSGFAASIYKRGMGLIAVPTTLLAQVDSSIGGKNGINYMNIKNLIGTFYNPKLIIDDISFIDDKKLMMDGLAESLKMGITIEPELFNIINNDPDYIIENIERIITLSINAKLSIVSKDFHDKKHLRYVLNFGHTIGHALESYFNNNISHGEAVANGMIIEAYISKCLGNADISNEIRSIIKRLGFKIIDFRSVDINRLLEYIKNDKKSESGYINIVAVNGIGRYKIEALSPEEMLRILGGMP